MLMTKISSPTFVTNIDVTFENLVTYSWFTGKIQIIHTKMNSTKCQIEFLVNSESFFEFEVDCLKSMKNNKVFLAGSEENAEPYPGEIRSVFIWFFYLSSSNNSLLKITAKLVCENLSETLNSPLKINFAQKLFAKFLKFIVEIEY